MITSKELKTNYSKILDLIQKYKQKYHITKEVILLAVSKKQPIDHISFLNKLGQIHFAENYLQEAVSKIKAIKNFNNNIQWHYIGKIQSNKTKEISQYFDWVHSLEKIKHAKLLNEHLCKLSPHRKLNVLIQVNIDQDSNKSGVDIDYVADLVEQIYNLKNSRLDLKGLMCILHANNTDFSTQYESFIKLQQLFKELSHNNLQTLSMGMTHDFEAAIKAGSNMIRIGTGLFGER